MSDVGLPGTEEERRTARPLPAIGNAAVFSFWILYLSYFDYSTLFVFQIVTIRNAKSYVDENWDTHTVDNKNN